MEYQSLSDHDLVARYCGAQSDQLAFDELWRRYEPTVRKYSKHLGYMCPRSSSRDLFVEDVFSDAQEIIIRKINQYEGRVPLSSWLWKITESIAINQRRKRLGRGAKRREFFDINEHEIAQQGAVFKDKIKQDPEFRAIRSERRVLLDDIIESHSATREGYMSMVAIVLYAFHDCKVREVAEIEGTYDRKIFHLFNHDYPRLREALAERGIANIHDVLTALE